MEIPAFHPLFLNVKRIKMQILVQDRRSGLGCVHQESERPPKGDRESDAGPDGPVSSRRRIPFSSAKVEPRVSGLGGRDARETS